jgi:hypothetical protein
VGTLPLRLLVLADSNQKDFIDCIKQICEGSEGEYEFHCLPEEVSTANEEDRLNRMIGYIEYADLILMDVTPHIFPSEEEKYRYITNQGVLIEYGVAISREDRSWRLKLFCEDRVERKHLHPYILKTVDTYNPKKLESLKNKVIKVIKEHKEKILEKQRVQERQLQAFQTLYLKSSHEI